MLNMWNKCVLFRQREVRNRIPRGLLVSRQLFMLCINDPEKEMKRKVSKFADDAKIKHGRPCCDADFMILQWNIDRLSEQAKDWQMEFNVGHFMRTCTSVK